MKNTLLIFFLVCTSIIFRSNDTYGQVSLESRGKNVVKLNILPPLLSSTGEISYERLVRSNLSLVTGLGANLRADQSDFQLNSDANLEFLNKKVQNFYLLGEVRRYICNCAAPHGFYYGGFIRYNQLNYTSNPQFTSGNTTMDINIDIDLRSFNFGGLLGYQLNFNNWLIDFEFAGLGYAPNWISFNSDSSLSNEALANLSDAISNNFGIGGNYKDIELNSSNAEFNFWYWTFRYAVSIGYNF